MTPEEKSLFKLYSCVSRSILKVCELRGSPISEDDFAARFSHLFPAGMFGLLTIDSFCTVVKDLGLCGRVSAIRNIQKVKEALAGGLRSHIFVLTDILSDGSELYHCRLALGLGKHSSDPTNEALLLYSPMQDGTSHEIWEPIAELEKQLVHFLIIQ